MSKVSATHPAEVPPEAPGSVPPASPGEPATAPPAPSEEGFASASHDLLFRRDDAACCDACGAPVSADDDDEGYEIPGAGVYLWARGDEVRRERAPLCASCASAVAAAALARWEIEEEEG